MLPCCEKLPHAQFQADRLIFRGHDDDSLSELSELILDPESIRQSKENCRASLTEEIKQSYRPQSPSQCNETGRSSRKTTEVEETGFPSSSLDKEWRSSWECPGCKSEQPTPTLNDLDLANDILGYHDDAIRKACWRVKVGEAPLLVPERRPHRPLIL
ncbi:hypothetical protein O3P69_006452 [Scylla paramamosain]|uniref:Uncharacterized protein n=1 Tax=Scylla paramamosain TaxID=85552 RepID=A0AAW0U3B9_SCYPA